MDILQINGIRAYGYVGVFAEEKTLGQWFTADLVIEADFQSAAQQDDLAQTLDYAEIIQLTQSEIAKARVNLIETLASHLLDRLLQFNQIQSVNILLTKESPPIPEFSGSVTVQMKRSNKFD